MGQYHVLCTDDGSSLAQCIFEVDRKSANCSIRMGAPESSRRRDFVQGHKVEIPRRA